MIGLGWTGTGRGCPPPAWLPSRLPAQAARPKIAVLKRRAVSSEARRRVSMTGLLQGPKRGLRPCGEDGDLGRPGGVRVPGPSGVARDVARRCRAVGVLTAWPSSPGGGVGLGGQPGSHQLSQIGPARKLQGIAMPPRGQHREPSQGMPVRTASAPR